MGCRPWQRDTAKPVAQSGESGVAAPAGDARWENRSLHGGGGEGGGGGRGSGASVQQDRRCQREGEEGGRRDERGTPRGAIRAPWV